MILGASPRHYNYFCQKLKTLRKASVMMELNCGTHALPADMRDSDTLYQHSYVNAIDNLHVRLIFNLGQKK
jgi:hypothetical protein